MLEDSNQLDARRSALDDDLEDMEDDEEEGEFKVIVAAHQQQPSSYLFIP